MHRRTSLTTHNFSLPLNMAAKSPHAEIDPPATEASRPLEQSADGALDAERNISLKDSFRLWPKAIIFSFLLSLAIVMEVRDNTALQLFNGNLVKLNDSCYARATTPA